MPIGMNHNTYNVNPSEDSVIEIGAIYGSARSNLPTGYLLCDGSAVSRTIYDRLFTAIGTSYGVGDSSTTFNLPDLRGAVPRGVGTSTGYSTNVTTTLGSKQDDAIQQISGTITHVSGMSVFEPINSGSFYGSNNVSYASIGSSGSPGYYPHQVYIDSSRQTRTATENRMKNIGINFFIKF